MISPTIGRVVHFYRYVKGQGHRGPLAALVCSVFSDSDVNLFVIGEKGQSTGVVHVKLLQDEESIPEHDYCAWMPFQKGQAAKTESLEKEIEKISQDPPVKEVVHQPIKRSRNPSAPPVIADEVG